MMTDVPKVYGAIAAVTAEIGKEGIAKGRKNQQQGYTFRGIDDVFNALSPLLAKHKLCILPRILSRAVTERQTQKGGVLFSVVVDAEFDFISAEDGSKHVVRMFGEAMDSADKATNKAMSAAYKYAAMQAFCIPTEGENDADGDAHEVAPRQIAPRRDDSPFDNEPPLDLRVAYLTIAKEAIRLSKNDADLKKWWGAEKDARRKNGLRQADVDDLKNLLTDRLMELTLPVPDEKVNGRATIYEPAKPGTRKEATNYSELLDDEIPF